MGLLGFAQSVFFFPFVKGSQRLNHLERRSLFAKKLPGSEISGKKTTPNQTRYISKGKKPTELLRLPSL